MGACIVNGRNNDEDLIIFMFFFSRSNRVSPSAYNQVFPHLKYKRPYLTFHLFAAELSLSLSKKTDFARTDFGPVSSPACTLIWAGDVLYGGNKIGEFSATLTKIKYGSNGTILSYDLMIPSGDTILEFISPRTNRFIPTGGVSADKGIIYAASPVFKDFIGHVVYLMETI
jgi:hypothetical protein